MKPINNDQSLPIRYEKVNIDEGITKLSNLILFYPYNPYNERSTNMYWLKSGNLPFCGIIDESHRKGYSIFTNWFERSRIHQHNIDVPKMRRNVIKRFLDLLNDIGYTKKKDCIEVNNYFKELKCWIYEMYKKIALKDDYGGWKVVALNEISRKDEYLRGPEHKYPQAIWISGEIENTIREVFGFRNWIFNLDSVKNILTSQELDELINEIFRLIGKNWISCDGGKLRILGNSIEEIEEKRVYKELERYPKVLENIDKAYEHKLNAEWNDVSLYCCKAIEIFYKNLLGNRNKYKRLTLSQLTQKIIEKKEDLFKSSDSTVIDGIKKLILSGINTIGTIRNTRDSGHGNERDVLKWEAKMGYNYTILLLRTILSIKK
ncbi:MAG: hypothetical protein ACFFCM_08540 [Promethearchaeota archaeon]